VIAAAGALAAGLASTFLATGAARADAPYPRSALVTGIAWDRSSYRSDGEGGDIWPVTAAADGKLYVAWGDGAVRCGAKVSYGVAVLQGGPNANLQGDGCGPPGQGQGKIGSLLAVGDTLYAVVGLQTPQDWPYADSQVWRSPDHGRSWQRPAWRFPGTAGALRPMNFVNFGAGDAGAPDDYAYMTAQKVLPDAVQRSAYLMRAPRTALGVREAYRYFAGTDAGGGAVWSASPGAAVPVFEDPAGVDGPEIVWDAGLGRFLLTAGHGGGGGGEIGVFEGPSLWGPWGTVDYEDRWLGMTGGEFLGLRFPPVWMRDGGRTLWAVFSCWGPGVCGPFHDRFNLIRATLAADGAGAPTPPPSPGGGSGGTPGTDGTGAPRGTAGPPGPLRAACRRIAENRGWTGIAAEGHGLAAGRGTVEVTGERHGGGRDRACRYDAGSGRARFDDQE
jgi:hypothetical protein